MVRSGAGNGERWPISAGMQVPGSASSRRTHHRNIPVIRVGLHVSKKNVVMGTLWQCGRWSVDYAADIASFGHTKAIITEIAGWVQRRNAGGAATVANGGFLVDRGLSAIKAIRAA